MAAIAAIATRPEVVASLEFRLAALPRGGVRGFQLADALGIGSAAQEI